MEDLVYWQTKDVQSCGIMSFVTLMLQYSSIEA